MNKINWVILILLVALSAAVLSFLKDTEPVGLTFTNCTFVEPNEPEYFHQYSIFDELKQEWVPCDGYWAWRDAQEWNEIVRKWPRVIVDPNYEYAGEHIKECATADGLSAWGMCMAGNEPPKNFGQAMIKIGKIVGVLATPENLMKVEFVEPNESEYWKHFANNTVCKTYYPEIYSAWVNMLESYSCPEERRKRGAMNREPSRISQPSRWDRWDLRKLCEVKE